MARIVECCDQRLACARWGNNQVAEIVPVEPFSFKLVKRGLLVGMWPQIEEHRRACGSAAWPLARMLQRQFHAAAKIIVVWPELFKFLVAPKRVESAPEAFDDLGSVDFAQLNGPFDTVFESGSRQVRRAHIHAAESVISLKEPCLGVQTAAATVE